MERDLRKDVIMSSFKSSGLNIAVADCEDHLIHCLKKDQTCSAGVEHLDVMASTIEDGREDSFSSLEESNVEVAALIIATSDNKTDDLHI